MEREIKTTGELLRYHRMRATLKQKDLAKLLGTARNYISSTEIGARHGSAKYLANFAKKLNLSSQDKAELLDSVLNQ